jgi:cyclophilin family peptidyl-prolyl cis-trans isomerase
MLEEWRFSQFRRSFSILSPVLSANLIHFLSHRTIMKAKRRSQSSRQSLQYQQLEDRRVMAAGIDRTPIVNLPNNKNVATNSGFELSTNGINNIYQDQNVQGWNVIAGGGSTMKIFPAGSTARGKVLQIDHVAGQRDGIFQDFEVRAFRSHLISFDLRASTVSPTADAQTNDVEVLWNGVSIGEFRPTDVFRRYKVMAEGTASTVGTLTFREVDAQGAPSDDGVGAQIDNVHVVQLTSDSARNGAFEDGTTVGSNSTISGWLKRGGIPFSILGSGAPSGGKFLNLDGDATKIDLIKQSFSAIPGETYIISFAAKLDPSRVRGGISDQIRVRFGDTFAGTVRGNNQWHRYHIVVKASTAQNEIVLREAGTKENQLDTGDGKGPWIDDIRFTRVTAEWELSVDLNGGNSGTSRDAIYTEGDLSKAVLGQDLVVFNRTRASLTGAKIVLTNAMNGSNESIAVNITGTSIRSFFDAAKKTLLLSGNDTAANYQKVLSTLTYRNVGENPTGGTRVIRISVQDQGAASNVANLNVNVVPVNDTPAIQPIADSAITAGTQFVLQVQASDAENQQLFYSISSLGTAKAAGENGPTISPTGEIRWTPGQGGDLNVVVTVRDTQGGNTQELFKLTSLLNAPLNGFVPFSGNRQLSFVTPSARNGVYTAPPALTINTSKTYEAILATDLGDLRLELYDDKTPITVNNFVALARDGYFDGLNFHRVINDLTNRFVAQGGDPRGTGTGGPGYQFADEFDATLNFSGSGVLAMANSGPGTNGSQFFITYSPQTHLNNKHTIFGRLVAGASVMDQFKSTATSSERVIIRKVTINES